MDQARRVTFHRRAAMALDAFSTRERARITDAARRLETPGDRANVEAVSAKLATSEPVYVLRATPTVRLIYRPTADGFEVLDVVKRATLQTFLKQAAGNATPAPTTVAGPPRAKPAPASARKSRPAAKVPAGTSNR